MPVEYVCYLDDGQGRNSSAASSTRSPWGASTPGSPDRRGALRRAAFCVPVVRLRRRQYNLAADRPRTHLARAGGDLRVVHQDDPEPVLEGLLNVRGYPQRGDGPVRVQDGPSDGGEDTRLEDGGVGEPEGPVPQGVRRIEGRAARSAGVVIETDPGPTLRGPLSMFFALLYRARTPL
jgi:hypothetical protein